VCCFYFYREGGDGMRVTFLFSDREPEDWYAEQVPRVGDVVFLKHGRYEVARVRHYFSTTGDAPQTVEIVLAAAASTGKAE
jgi:hypothetical protein